METIWVLGSAHAKAHKSISWLSSFPNFSNADVLIVNLQSLGTHQLAKRKNNLDIEARRYMFDMLMTGEKKVIVIMSKDQKFVNWLPIRPVVNRIAPVTLGEIPDDLLTQRYLSNVENCDYYIGDFDPKYPIKKTMPKSEEAEIYHFTSEARDGYDLRLQVVKQIKNVAKQIIGGNVSFMIFYGASHYDFRGRHISGSITFLPPPTEVSTKGAIDGLIDVLLGSELSEPLPRWEQEIDLPGLSHLETEIARKEKDKKKLIAEIEKLNRRKDDLTKLRRLLWADGVPLENVVRDAFVILGFQEIRKVRDPNLEDWVIELNHVSKFEYGVLEITGKEKRTSLADLTQCNKWVEDYLLDNVRVKGIFIPNQYRRMDIQTNLDKREEFAPNELEYARKREICILPTHEIFEAVAQKMNGKGEISREFIEKKIASANGLCRLI